MTGYGFSGQKKIKIKIKSLSPEIMIKFKQSCDNLFGPFWVCVHVCMSMSIISICIYILSGR